MRYGDTMMNPVLFGAPEIKLTYKNPVKRAYRKKQIAKDLKPLLDAPWMASIQRVEVGPYSRIMHAVKNESGYRTLFGKPDTILHKVNAYDGITFVPKRPEGITTPFYVKKHTLSYKKGMLTSFSKFVNDAIEDARRFYLRT